MNNHVEFTEAGVPGEASSVRSRWVSAAISVLLGMLIVYGVGFAPGTLHGSAHDARHSVGLICH
ncbi:MAG: CbtB domain-containing protein [Pseudomonadota bacterium]|uniref:CbtB domain-containing protein n=1 Tax=Aquabacterium parvum TaxID=70584 RepID=UPI0009F9840D